MNLHWGEGAMGNAHTTADAMGIDSQVIKFLPVRAEWNKVITWCIVVDKELKGTNEGALNSTTGKAS